MRTLYFRPVSSFFLSFLVFPLLISAVADWMSTILPHMVWPLCEFWMQVWNVTYCPRLTGNAGPKISPKIAILAPSHNFVEPYLRQSEKNMLSSNISSTCPHSMVNFGPLAAEIDPVVWGTPANFNGFRVLAALLHGIKWASAKLCGVEQRAPPIFGRAAITLNIGPHSSFH